MTCDCRRGESELKYGIITNNCKETGQDINCKPWGKGRGCSSTWYYFPPSLHQKMSLCKLMNMHVYHQYIRDCKIDNIFKKNTAFDINNGDWIKQLFKN